MCIRDRSAITLFVVPFLPVKSQLASSVGSAALVVCTVAVSVVCGWESSDSMAYVVGTTATIVDIAINDAAIFFQCFTASLLVLCLDPLVGCLVRLYVNANIICDDTITALRLSVPDSLCI